ncbi:MAG: hypothetical protein A2Y64_07040 [Candidatus Coatesbacteria bacterium RBG_13_66_14]|uniref:Uncharacterized protein n=1 Tax=Candidatus Coatesbacteria bacterium RBG_13_66_14 TaxID=1817816 RepID=A0A1F5EW59_9BACT|nr:MAG: hypothetical protein A2Y64_07040 [Candidatus Coatesbacteria bacterium RBG_13_66_14]
MRNHITFIAHAAMLAADAERLAGRTSRHHINSEVFTKVHVLDWRMNDIPLTETADASRRRVLFKRSTGVPVKVY